MIDDRLKQLESNHERHKERLDAVDKALHEISMSTAAMSRTQEIISQTLIKVNDNINAFRTFEIRTQSNCITEREKRDVLTTAVAKLTENTDKEFNIVHSSLRKQKEVSSEKFHAIDVKLAVESVEQGSIKQTLDLSGVRIWRVMTAVLASAIIYIIMK